MCATPCLKCPAVLATLAADVSASAAVVAAPAAVEKAILFVPTPRAVVSAAGLVAKKVKALKGSAPATLDEFAVC